jgi:hypothetical protein
MSHDETRFAQLAENRRHYADMRFKQPTLLTGAMTALGAGVAQYPGLKVPLAVSAALFTSVMWVMEVRSTLFCVAIYAEAPGLYPPRLTSLFGWLNATTAVFFLHVALYAFWSWCAARWSESYCVAALGVVFSVGNYWPIRKHVWAGRPRVTGAS